MVEHFSAARLSTAEVESGNILPPEGGRSRDKWAEPTGQAKYAPSVICPTLEGGEPRGRRQMVSRAVPSTWPCGSANWRGRSGSCGSAVLPGCRRDHAPPCLRGRAPRRAQSWATSPPCADPDVMQELEQKSPAPRRVRRRHISWGQRAGLVDGALDHNSGASSCCAEHCGSWAGSAGMASALSCSASSSPPRTSANLGREALSDSVDSNEPDADDQDEGRDGVPRPVRGRVRCRAERGGTIHTAPPSRSP